MWNPENTQDFVERSAAVNSSEKYGVTPLMVAAQSGKMHVTHYVTEIAAMFRLMQFLLSPNCKQHTVRDKIYIDKWS
jgi:ankyrin repeat protein